MGFINNEELDELTGKRGGISQPARLPKAQASKVDINIDYDYVIPEEQKIQMCRKFVPDEQLCEDFNKDNYYHSLNFYDFEVFMHDWCLTVINPVGKQGITIVNDMQALKRYYDAHKDEIWVGYNSRNYDIYIMKSLLLGLNPKKTNDDLIIRGIKGRQISGEFKKIKLLDFDIYSKNSLKVLEGYMGADIRETGVDFNLRRQLTRDEILQTIRYNIHDVEQTIEVFRRNKYLYESQMQLIETFKMPISSISLTQAQLTANILECKPQERGDEFDLQIVDVLQLDKYKAAEDWFRDRNNRDYKKSFSLEVCGVPHNFGWGGVHGAPEEPLHIKGGYIYHIDVTSYYPSIMINFDMLTRNCKYKDKYKKIYDMRVRLKKEGKKKEQAPYKIVLNGTYGICKDRHSAAYDPRQANNICVNGQLMLLDLLEHLEKYITLIQSNTDGLIVKINDEQDIETVMGICHEWEMRTGMGLGFDEIEEIYQKDVNNYIFRFKGGKLERKGAYVMQLDDLNYDLPIINEALVNYMMSDTPVEETILGCQDLRKFQKIIKVSSNYKFASHNGKRLIGKTFRVFASRDVKDGYIGKCKDENATIEKFANTPEYCFIVNEAVNGVVVPQKLDKRWYIALAEKRLKDFGINVDCYSLF